jgi:hypothetical protein
MRSGTHRIGSGQTPGINRFGWIVGAALAGGIAASAAGQTGPQQPADDAAQPAGDPAVPVVKSKEDFLALDRDERRVFSRSRRPAASFFVEGGGRYSSPAELDGTNTEISVARLRAALGLSFRVNDDTDFILRLGNEFSFYEFDSDGPGAPGIIPGMPGVDEPFDSVRSTTITPILRSLPETGWQWTLGGRVTSAGEPGADFGESIAAGGFGFASYDVTENLRLGAGLNVVTRLEGGVFVLPLPFVQWDVTDDVRIGTTERGFGATYFIDQNWSVGADVTFMRREYRLADDNAIPGGSFTDIRIPVTLAVTYAPSPRTVFTARIGSETFGDLEFNDANENQVASYDLSPNLMVGLDLRIAF